MGGSMTRASSNPASSDGLVTCPPMPAEISRPDKHNAITRAAADVFLAEGFERASLDQIAHKAGVSKQTIYSHFADKQALFRAICAELTEKLTVHMRKPRRADTDLRSILIRLGEETLATMLNPAALDLHRLVVSAAARFPDLGHSAYEVGVLRMIDDLSALLMQRSQLRDGLGRPISETEARRMAEQFIGMLRGFHQTRGLLGIPTISAAERKTYVRSCVAMLLASVPPE